MSKDLYQTLGVQPNATKEEIKQAYRSLAQIHHPDKGGDTVNFQKIKEAYEVISDPIRREVYDQTGNTDIIDVRQYASSALASIFDALLKEYIDDDYTAILPKVTSINATRLASMQRDLTSLQEKLKSLTTKKNNVTTQNSNNLYLGVVEQQLQQIHLEIIKVSDAILISKEIETLLKDYSEIPPKERNESYTNNNPFAFFTTTA